MAGRQLFTAKPRSRSLALEYTLESVPSMKVVMRYMIKDLTERLESITGTKGTLLKCAKKAV